MKNKLSFFLSAVMVLFFWACNGPNNDKDPLGPDDPPPKVTNFRLSEDAEDGVAQFRWNASLDASGYKFFYAKETDEFPASPHATVTTTSYTLTGFEDDVAYKAIVVAFNTAGNAAASDVVNFMSETSDPSRVFKPSVMNFERAVLGDFSTPNWTNVAGGIGSTGPMNQSIQANPNKTGNTSNQTISYDSTDQSGNRGAQLNFTSASDSVQSAKFRHGIAFDWYPGVPTSNIGYIGIQDGTSAAFSSNGGTMDNQFIGLYVVPDNMPTVSGDSSATSAKLYYRIGNVPSGADVGAPGVQAELVPLGISDAQKWYRVVVIINTDINTIELSITDLATKTVSFERVHIPFAQGISYNPKIASIRFFANRVSPINQNWRTYIDNFELYRDEGDVPVIGNVPESVTNLRCTDDTDAKASFSWNQAALASGYLFYVTGGVFSEASPYVATIDGIGNTTHTVTGLVNGTAYQAKVVAFNDIGNAPASNAVSFTPSNLPVAVSDLQYTDAAEGKATFFWSSAVRATSYEFYYAQDAGAYPSAPEKTLTNADIPFIVTISGLTDGTVYKAKVVSVNVNGSSIDFAEVKFTPAALEYTRAFPQVHFEDIPTGNYTGGDLWTSQAGAIGAPTGALSQMVQDNPLKTGNTSSKALRIQGSAQTGARGIQFNFITATNTLTGSGTKHGIAFDWYPGAASPNNGSISIQDGTSFAGTQLDNIFISLFVIRYSGSDYRIGYRTGNPSSGDVGTADGTSPPANVTEISGAGFAIDNTEASKNKWYRVVIIIDTGAKKIDLTFNDILTGAKAAEISGIDFASGIEYNPGIASMRFYGARNSGNLNWTTYIDNLELFRYKN